MDRYLHYAVKLLCKLADKGNGEEDASYIAALMKAEADGDIDTIDMYLEQLTIMVDNLRIKLKCGKE